MILPPKKNSALLGTLRVPEKFLRSHTAIIGSSGSGKTTLFDVLIDSVLGGQISERLKSINGFLADPKNQLYRALMERGLAVKIILTNVLDRRGWAWAIWQDLLEHGGAAAEQFAFDMLPDERSGGGNNQFFTDAPRHILAGVLRELVRLRRRWTLRLAYHFAMDWFYAEQLFSRSPDPVVRSKLVLLNRDQGVTRANVHASLLTKLGNTATYAALMEHAKNEFSVRQALRSDVLVVLGSDFRFSHILGPMNALMLKVVRQQLLSREDDPEGLTPTYLFIDELAKLSHNANAPVDDFEDFLELGRSKNARVVYCIQSPEQLKKLYGPEGMSSLLGNCGNKLIFRVSDRAGATECSDMLPYFHGYEELVAVGETWSRHDYTKSRTVTEARVDRPLVPPSMIQFLPLADWRRGWKGFGVCGSLSEVPAWEDRITPEFLHSTLGADVARSLVEQELEELLLEQGGKELLLPYEQCLRTADEQYLAPLTRSEVEEYGLTFDPDGYRPLEK